MFDQKAIVIPKEYGLRAFGEAVSATLEELVAEHWDSRLFQLGPAGLLIVARRPKHLHLDGPDSLLSRPTLRSHEFDDTPDSDDPDAEDDDLEPTTREMLDKIFDLVGPVPLEEAVAAMPSAVPGIARLYPARFLENSLADLRRHRQEHVDRHGEETEQCEYGRVLQAVIERMHIELRNRLS
ncbi:MAG: hypothetical protein MUF54_03300 [Polyangiaceae bacterium]|jgi:hypothetical protein|nr:hypothetical protein [Polyangiaceae bacterium]